MSPAALGLALVACAAWGAPMGSSPTLDLLKRQAAQDPAAAASPEAAKSASGKGFTGEGDKPAPSARVAQAGDEETPTYHFEGSSPMKGVNIYTPVKDPPGGDGHTNKPSPKGLVGDGVVAGLAVGGLAAAGGGIAALAAGGAALTILGGGLLFLGGAALALGILFGILNKKAKG